MLRNQWEELDNRLEEQQNNITNNLERQLQLLNVYMDSNEIDVEDDWTEDRLEELDDNYQIDGEDPF